MRLTLAELVEKCREMKSGDTETFSLNNKIIPRKSARSTISAALQDLSKGAFSFTLNRGGTKVTVTRN